LTGAKCAELATRSMLDGVHLIERINARGGMIKVLHKAHLDLSAPIGRGVIAFLSTMAEDERQRILARCNADRQVAKPRASSSPKAQAHRPSAGRSPQAPGCRRKLPGHR
jgi:DNA invertase Pin-like site-specific DNA recombinase